MECHGNHNESQNINHKPGEFQAKGSRFNHIVLICLGIMTIIVVAKLIFNVPFETIFYVGIFAACPLLHVFMMGHGEHKDSRK